MIINYQKFIQTLPEDAFKYGFALVDLDYIRSNHFAAGRIEYYTKSPEKNIVRRGADLQELAAKDTVLIDLTVSEEEFSKIRSELVCKDLVQTFKFCLEKFPEQTCSILRAMPTAFYEDKDIAKEIFSSIQKTPEALKEAQTAMEEKMEVIKEARVIQTKGTREEKSKEETVDEQYNNFLKDYQSSRAFIDKHYPKTDRSL